MSSAGFELRPFRGLRFAQDRVGGLGTVISPPYDVLDAELVRSLEDANRYNVVRLILSRHHRRPYYAVRQRLERWREEGMLAADERAGLYVYEYTAEGRTVRGLIGLVGLRDPVDRVVVPHEDTMPAFVADRADLMSTTGTNLEPILLVHQGSPAVRAAIEDAVAEPPIAAGTGPDGSQHRLWCITDEPTLSLLAAELESTQALIADGHHRYAAYLRLRDELGSAPWQSGLAMLVDQDDHPLHVGPIHRFVQGLTVCDLEDAAAARGDVVRRHDDIDAAQAAAAQAPRDVSVLVVSDGDVAATYRTNRTHELDVAVLHADLLPAWSVADDQVEYHHRVDQALGAAQRHPGVAILLSTPTWDQVLAVSAEGRRMPRKSTSFQPKPSMGLVMRDVREG